MSDSAADYIPPPYPTSGPFDATGTINADVACRKCGYNLRGLKNEGRCPECGTPVGFSTVGDLLRYSDPAWLTILTRGMSYILWGILVSILVAVVTIPLRSELLNAWLSIAGGLLGVAGAWLLTEPDPSGLGEDQYATSRKLVRVALVVGLGGELVAALTQTLPIPEALQFVLTLAVGLAGLFGVVGEFAKFIYLEKLARRVPDVSLAERARLLRWGYGLTLAAAVIMGLIVAVFAASGGGPGRGIAAIGCFGAIIGIAFLVFGIMTLFFYIRMRRTLIAQEAAARQIWGTALPAES